MFQQYLPNSFNFISLHLFSNQVYNQGHNSFHNHNQYHQIAIVQKSDIDIHLLNLVREKRRYFFLKERNVESIHRPQLNEGSQVDVEEILVSQREVSNLKKSSNLQSHNFGIQQRKYHEEIPANLQGEHKLLHSLGNGALFIGVVQTGDDGLMVGDIDWISDVVGQDDVGVLEISFDVECYPNFCL